MDKTKKPWINGFFFLATLGFNALGAAGVINGLSQNEISDRYMTLITPSPSTFSIWGLIYVLLFLSIIMMIVKKEDSYYEKAIDEVSVLFRISCGFNIAWIVAFSYLQLVLSTFFILGFVIVLTLICLRLLKIHKRKYFLLPLTFGLYTGWVFIATVVNIAATLVKAEWTGFGLGPDLFAGIILIVSLGLIFIVLTRIRNAIFPLPVAWAYFGIYQSLQSPEGFNGQFETLQIVALVGMTILGLMVAVQFYQNHFRFFPEQRFQWNA